MGWYYVSYLEAGHVLSLAVEPMVEGADIVYVPDEATWERNAPPWASGRRSQILSRLRSTSWNRRLDWREAGYEFSVLGPGKFVSGSLESTRGGRFLEGLRMFDPGGGFSHDEAHRWYHRAVRTFCEELRGEVSVSMTEVVPGSVFQDIGLRTLKANPYVTLNYKKKV